MKQTFYDYVVPIFIFMMLFEGNDVETEIAISLQTIDFIFNSVKLQKNSLIRGK
jgi:hypothetical protein